MEPLQPSQNQSQSKTTSTSLKRFSVGATVGLIIAATQWSGYAYFVDNSVPLTKGIMFCLVLMIVSGLMTLKWGYKTLESLLQLLQ